MTFVRSTLIVSALALAGTVAIVAQGAPPRGPAPSGITTSRTWTDADLDKLMKEIGSTVGMIRKSIDGQNAEMLKQQSDRIEALFEEVDDFWTARNVQDAMGWADDAAEHSDHIEDAADEKDFTKAAEHLKLLQGNCAQCHTKYRDKGPDGQYRIKP
jgi:hypothetical protein